MAPLTEEQVDAVRDVAVLQRLLKEQLTTAAAAAEGEGRNVAVLLKQEPPLLDECEDYAVWRMKFEVWQSGTAMNDKQQAVCIIQGLADDHKYHKKGLQSLMLKTLSKDELKNPTTKKVLEFLDDQLGSTTEEKLFDAYTAFIKSEIRPGEKYEDFVVRFEGEYQTMLQAGSDVKIPGEILALQLILASKLTSSMLISIRANVKWEGDKIYENTKKAIARICRGEVNKIGNNAQVKLMTDEGALDIRRQDGCLLVDGERYYSLSDAQVLVGEGVPEGRGGPRGRRRGGRPEPEAVVEQLETRNAGAVASLATEQPTAKTSWRTRKRLESATTLERTGAQRLTRWNLRTLMSMSWRRRARSRKLTAATWIWQN